MLPKGSSFVLGIPMNSKSATYNVFQAEPLYHTNNNGKTAAVHQFLKPYIAIATDNTNFAELAASTLQECTGSAASNCASNCAAKAFRLLLMKRFFVSRRCILIKRYQHSENCPVSSVLLPEAPQAIYLANGVYEFLSHNPTVDIKNNSQTHGLSLSSIDCQACVLRPSCQSTIYINQGDFVLSPDMDAYRTTPEPYIATIKLAPALKQVFQNVPFDRFQLSKLLSWCCPEINS